MRFEQRICDRFWKHVDRETGPMHPELGRCWIWTGALYSNGYGHFTTGGIKHPKSVLAHRMAIELTIGPIPSGLTIDHLCRVRACVRPDHLEPVTNSTNLRRGIGVGGDRGTPRDPDTGRFTRAV